MAYTPGTSKADFLHHAVRHAERKAQLAMTNYNNAQCDATIAHQAVSEFQKDVNAYQGGIRPLEAHHEFSRRMTRFLMVRDRLASAKQRRDRAEFLSRTLRAELNAASAQEARVKMDYEAYLEHLWQTEWVRAEQERTRQQFEAQRTQSERRREREAHYRWQQEEAKARSKAESEARNIAAEASSSRNAAPKVITQVAIENFLLAAEEACSGDYATLKVFPDPPAERCRNIACLSQEERALDACACCIKKSFADVANIRKVRLWFHPDKFARCSPDVRAVFQAKANEIFVVLSSMM